MTKKRVRAYYDGSNFYHHCLYNYGIKDINFFDMTTQLLILDKEELVKIKYFNSPVNQQENQGAYQAQQKFFAKLRNTSFVQILLGSLVRRPLKKININCPDCGHQKADFLKCSKCQNELDIEHCFRYTEKGVDVKLAINLLLDALNDKYDVALLFSSDADFSPAIKHVIKQLNKEIVYCHFPNPKTSQLIQCCSSSRLITKDMVEKSQVNHSK